jgi:hypothetical protein
MQGFHRQRVLPLGKASPGVITCPKWGYEFGLSGVLTGRIREHLKAELEQEKAKAKGVIRLKSRLKTGSRCS